MKSEHPDKRIVCCNCIFLTKLEYENESALNKIKILEANTIMFEVIRLSYVAKF